MADQVTRTQADKPAERNYQRYEYAKRRGHTSYMLQAARCEAFYMGAGRHWSAADRVRMFNTGGRPTYEINEIFPRLNSAIGYQIHNRMDISFLPRGGMSDSAKAAIRSKIAMQICDHTNFHWKETQVFSDGLIEQRGYFDVRMVFDKNVFGDVGIDTLDPRDVVPDPDAKSYDPDQWLDVTVTRWYSLDEIEGHFGKKARLEVEKYLDTDGDWGEYDSSEGPRNKFGSEGVAVQTWDSLVDDVGIKKYRVLDRQYWRYELTQVAIYPTGDIKPINEGNKEQIQEYLAQGAVLSKRMVRRVRWEVTTRFATLFEDWSPYDRFTIIPYFCFFRRGQTLGLVDNAISPQEVLNKAISQFVHILNTTANSGWVIEQGSLVNTTPEKIENEGSKSGLVLIYKQGMQKPEKIKPNEVPQGMDRLMEHAYTALKSVTSPDAMMGLDDKVESGVALQSKQFVAQNQLAIPLDNLSRTRHMVARFIDYLITMFYDNARQFRITETDPMTGKEATVTYNVNVFDPATRTWTNDLTEGDYDTVVSEQPMQITFQNSQYSQAMEMKKEGINIPDAVVIKHSNLSEKADIIEQMSAAQPELSPLDQAKAALLAAQTTTEGAKADKLQADTAEVRVTSQFGVVQAATAIATNPAIAPLADALALSAGVVDQNPAPNIPSPPAGTPAVPLGISENTSPQFPAKPASPLAGATDGIEGGSVTPPAPLPDQGMP